MKVKKKKRLESKGGKDILKTKTRQVRLILFRLLQLEDHPKSNITVFLQGDFVLDFIVRNRQVTGGETYN